MTTSEDLHRRSKEREMLLSSATDSDRAGLLVLGEVLDMADRLVTAHERIAAALEEYNRRHSRP